MTIKHGSHTFNLDPAATDTYRHFHEGQAERVAMISPDRFAVVMRWETELAPQDVAERYMSDADLVLCEGFKTSTIPKIEIFRTQAHPRSLVGEGEIDAATLLAMVTDDAPSGLSVPTFSLADDGWLTRLADFVQHWVDAPRGDRSPTTMTTDAL